MRLEEGGPVLAFSSEKIPKQGCTQAIIREHWEGIGGQRALGRHWEATGYLLPLSVEARSIGVFTAA